MTAMVSARTSFWLIFFSLNYLTHLTLSDHFAKFNNTFLISTLYQCLINTLRIPINVLSMNISKIHQHINLKAMNKTSRGQAKEPKKNTLMIKVILKKHIFADSNESAYMYFN